MEPELEEHDAEFADAFNEGELPADAGDGEVEGVATSGAAGDAGQDGGGKPPAESVAVVLSEEATGGDDAQPASDIEKERQRLKSWEGRLKAREAEIEGRAAKPAVAADQGGEAADALEDVAAAAEAKGSTDMAAAAEAAAEAVEAGEMSAEEAIAQLSEDFGEDFIKMIKSVVKTVAKAEIAPVTKTVDDVVSSIKNKEEREHFGAIAAKHPDFADVGRSDTFKAYIEGLPESERGNADRVSKGGSANEVIALLDAYKKAQELAKSQKPAAADTSESEPGLEELEGVRSGGVRLPEKPTPGSDDYAGAWEQF